MVNLNHPMPRIEFPELYPFESHFLQIDGFRYHYVDEGPEEESEALPVVMVHGNPSWSFYYRNLVLSLRGKHRCIVPDHMGCGWSDVPEDSQYEYTLERRVADLDRLIESLQLKRFILVVHDWGGMIGSAWATQHPERVAALVVLNTGGFSLPEGKRLPASIALARTPWLGELLVRGASAFSRGANRYCVTRAPMPKAVQKAYLRPYDSWKNRIAVHHFVLDIPLKKGDRSWDLVQQSSEKLVALRDKPILLCWGMRDFVFDHHFLRAWEEHFPKAKVCRYEDAGHYILEDAFSEVNAEIQSFLRDLDEPKESHDE